jgi:acetyl-CoA carboxylase biotin carboxyl carrier protein
MEHKLLAPLSGKIVQVNIAAGNEVEEDDEAIVIEAMKMETPVLSPCNGTAKEVRVKAGDKVDEGDLLAILAEG